MVVSARNVVENLHILRKGAELMWDAAFSPDGETLASGSAEHTVLLWRVTDGTLMRTLKGYPGPVLSVAFSPRWAVLGLIRVGNCVAVESCGRHSLARLGRA
jgi:WD40 repeat protein